MSREGGEDMAWKPRYLTSGCVAPIGWTATAQPQAGTMEAYPGCRWHRPPSGPDRDSRQLDLPLERPLL